ncbi:helix-turn-helix domain-containing protein [Streptomyces sp. BH105]|uniref:helix-turn-helix domain-containing protein n=1 Tax=Streptomyces sp. BH105 TaxID=3410408 RepID=UPI003CEB589B
MGLRREPTARQRRLGAELRKLREAAGLRGREAAELLGVSAAQITQIEVGLSGVSEQRLRQMAANYACTDSKLIDALVVMATSRSQGWWEEYQWQLPPSFLDIAELEHHSTYRRDVEFLLIPGLLQTDGYARAAFSSRIPELPDREVDLRVQHRMQRKAILERANPVPYEAVLHEAALRIRVGDRVVARAQLAHLLEHSDAEHITLRVIPFDLDNFGGAWSTLMLAGGAHPRLDTAVRDAPHGTPFIDSEAQLGVFRTLFRKVEEASLDPKRSRDVVHKLAKEL